jgi:putative addiction module component (TIGR02574 family)
VIRRTNELMHGRLVECRRAERTAIRHATLCGVSERAEELLTEALKLPTAERARLGAELIASVDGEPEADADAAWAAEIERRVVRLRTEGPKGADWRTVHARIENTLRKK